MLNLNSIFKNIIGSEPKEDKNFNFASSSMSNKNRFERMSRVYQVNEDKNEVIIQNLKSELREVVNKLAEFKNKLNEEKTLNDEDFSLIKELMDKKRNINKKINHINYINA